MSPAPAAAATASQQRQAIGGLNPGVTSEISPQTVQNNTILPAPLQGSQYQFGFSSQPQASITTQGISQTHLENIGSVSGQITTSTPQAPSMPPPPLPSQALHKVSPSSELDAPEIASQNAAPSASGPQPTQLSHTSSQTYTVPSSSQVSARQDNVDAEKVVSQATEREVAVHPLIVTLKESTSLYGLPLDVLERAVGDIIREDGFIPLVEKLDQMWKIKSLIVKH